MGALDVGGILAHMKLFVHIFRIIIVIWILYDKESDKKRLKCIKFYQDMDLNIETRGIVCTILLIYSCI